MDQKISLTYYSDLLCVWAYIGQARVDEVAESFVDDVSIDYRFCSVFGDTAYKIGTGWADRGSYKGFGKHICEVVSEYGHVKLHPDIWQRNPPHSSAPAHVLVKATQRVDSHKCTTLMRELRSAFFERCLDIGSWSILETVLEAAEVSVSAVLEVIKNGAAYADLEADYREQQRFMVQGSPTYILNEGRQKLYGNVGYSVIEANIRELLKTPRAGQLSWC